MANANPKCRSTARRALDPLCDPGVAVKQAGASLRSSVEKLLCAGGLVDASVQGSCDLLLSLAETDLSLARLIEGHLNAAHLIVRFGGDVPTGLLGVLGADSRRPASFDGHQLLGVKQYASGLGIVEHAVVSVATDAGVRLALVRADDATRHDPRPWRMTGMQATVSGHFILDGLRPLWLGPPDAYFMEPWFLGRVWRIAALQTGGTLWLLTAARDHLAAIDRLDADAQVARLAPLFGRAFAARGLIERAAHVAEGAEGRGDPDRAVALSVMARLMTEDLAQGAIKAVERSLGLSHFEDGSPTGAKARDLAVYCRQVARDALEQKSGADRPASRKAGGGLAWMIRSEPVPVSSFLRLTPTTRRLAVVACCGMSRAVAGVHMWAASPMAPPHTPRRAAIRRRFWRSFGARNCPVPLPSLAARKATSHGSAFRTRERTSSKAGTAH